MGNINHILILSTVGFVALGSFMLFFFEELRRYKNYLSSSQTENQMLRQRLSDAEQQYRGLQGTLSEAYGRANQADRDKYAAELEARKALRAKEQIELELAGYKERELNTISLINKMEVAQADLKQTVGLKIDSLLIQIETANNELAKKDQTIKDLCDEIRILQGCAP